MDYYIISNALMLALSLSLPVLAAALAGALVAGVIKVAMQIEDPVIGFAGKFTALAILGFFAASRLYGEIVSFTGSIWGNASLYH